MTSTRTSRTTRTTRTEERTEERTEAGGTASRGTGGTASPRGYLTIGRTVAVPVRRVSVVMAVVLVILIVAAATATLSLGRLGIPLADLPAAVTGGAQGADSFVMERLRGPRLVVGIGTGAALGLSGALFQSVTRNPLGSPDVIGLGAGAGAGAATVALLLPDTLPVSVGALMRRRAGHGAGVRVDRDRIP